VELCKLLAWPTLAVTLPPPEAAFRLDVFMTADFRYGFETGVLWIVSRLPIDKARELSRDAGEFMRRMAQQGIENDSIAHSAVDEALRGTSLH
jgi:hypothetical protein